MLLSQESKISFIKSLNSICLEPEIVTLKAVEFCYRPIFSEKEKKNINLNLLLQAGFSAAPTRAISSLKSINIPQQIKDIKLPDLPQAIKDLKM